MIEKECNHRWLKTKWLLTYGRTPVAQRRVFRWLCKHCKEERLSSCKPFTQRKGA